MASQLDNSMALVREFVQSALQRLPEPAQNVVQSPLAQKALVVLLALGILRSTNRYLSKWSLNNWQNVEPFNLATELVLITGGCSGIGKAVMEDLATRGIKVVIIDILDPAFKLPSNVAFYKADITSSANIREVAEQIRANHGDPTVLVNNAGVGYDGTILEEPEAKIRTTFEVNTMSHFWMVKEFLPSMIKKNHGHVVTVASMASFVALGEMTDYACSKASAMAFNESLTQELRFWYNAPKVRTSCIHPMWVRTAMTKMLTDAGDKFKDPVMTVEFVAGAIVKQILGQKSGSVILPAHLSVASCVRAFPTWLQERVRSTSSNTLLKLRETQPYKP